MAAIKLAPCPNCHRVHGEWNIALTSKLRICRHCRAVVSEYEWQKSLIRYAPEPESSSFKDTLKAAVATLATHGDQQTVIVNLGGGSATPSAAIEHTNGMPPATPVPTRSRVDELIAIVRAQMGDAVADALLTGTDPSAIEAAVTQARQARPTTPDPPTTGPLGKRKIKL